jgi:hypothetical protein
MPRTNSRLTPEEYQAINSKLEEVRDYLLSLTLKLGATYGPSSKPTRFCFKSVTELDKLVTELENKSIK